MTDTNPDHYTILKKLENGDITSQRALVRETGFCLGKVNYLLKALLGKGFVKLDNFRKSNNKPGYRYLLTPGGVGEKARLARVFLKRKTQEYEQLQYEIEELKLEVQAAAETTAQSPADNR
jgi:EPS-associated MarR family transcriptional regulator